MSNENLTRYKYYLLEFGDWIKIYALEEVKDRRMTFSSTSRAYYDGLASAYHDVISLMQQQAEAFDIPLRELKLHDIDPDRDLK